MESKYLVLTVLLVGVIHGAGLPPLQELQLSSPRKAVSVVEADDKLFLIGGFEYHSMAASTKIDVFDLNTKLWNKTIDLLSPRGFISPVVIEPRIYCIGGFDLVNTPYLYSTTKRDLVPLPPGPTVRKPESISIHKSMLTVVGDFSADFFDMQNNRSTFYPELTSVMAQLYFSATFSYRDLVFVIGGENTTTHEMTFNAWIFNATSRNLTEYSNVTSNNQTAYKMSVSENVVAVRFSSSVQLMYHLVQDRWIEETNVMDPIESVTVNDVTHMFGSYYKSYNWLTGQTKESNDGQINIGFAFQGRVIYITDTNIISVASNGAMDVYSGRGVSFSDKLFAAPWNNQQYVFANSDYIYIFNSNSNDITTLNGFNRVGSVFIRDETTLVAFDVEIVGFRILSSTMKTYDTTMTLTSTTSLVVPMIPQYIVGNDFVDYKTGMSAKVSDVQNMSNFTVSFTGDISTTQVQDASAVILIDSLVLNDVTIPQYQHYHKMDVYNYDTHEWEDSIPLPEEFTTEIIAKYALAAVVDNKILMWFKSGYGYYDVSAKSWTTFTDDVDNYRRIYDSANYATLEEFVPTPVFDGIAFIPHFNFNQFFKVNPTNMNQPSITSQFVSDGSELSFGNRLKFQDSIYVTAGSNKDGGSDGLGYYNVSTDSWQTFYSRDYQLFIATFASDVVLMFDINQTLTLFNTSLGTPQSYSFDNPFHPALGIQAQDGNITLVAGGEHNRYGTYTDRVLVFIAPDAIVSVAPFTDDSSAPVMAPSGLSDSDFIVVIVVPIVGSLLIAGLIVFLVLFLKRRKRRSSVKTVGLEQRFGDWFTPFNDIQFGTLLGQGANGQVFKGKWKNTDVALKVSMTQAEQSVISELTVMINLRPHPNAVQLFGFSVHPETNNVILILEFCNGGSLDAMLYDSTEPIPLEQKTAWLQGISHGVAHLHANNIVHRDIAARNVLIHQGEPKLTDFGMSRQVDEQQQRGTTKSDLGPIRWMAPESLKHKQYSTKSDVWTFGILMYEIILQQEPHFEASDPILIGTLIRDEGLAPRVPPPPLCPSEFASLMRQCWALKPDQRPTMDTVSEQLDKIKHDE